MSIEQFIFHHPQAYNRLLVAGIAVMTIAGLASMVVPETGKQDKKAGIFAMEVPRAPEPQLRRLPGRDGSANPSRARLETPYVQPAPSVPAAPAITALSNSGDARSMGRAMNALKFGDAHWPALNALWTRESNWNPGARNASSGACGIPQALPCSKIPDMSTSGQISWGLSYIQSRYGNPSNAWRFWLSHHWY